MELTPQPLLLIEEVKKHEGLWSSSLGVTREERMEMWKQVGAGMYPDWSAHSKAVQYDIIIQLQSKWRSIRDGYNRELRFRKTGVRKYNKTYVYFKKLLFLGGYDGEVSSEGEEFPADPVIAARWTAIIRRSRGENSWKPRKHSIICSAHFNDSDFYLTKGGLKRLSKGSVPHEALFLSSTPSNNVTVTVLSNPLATEAVKPHESSETDESSASSADDVRPHVSLITAGPSKLAPDNIQPNDIVVTAGSSTSASKSIKSHDKGETAKLNTVLIVEGTNSTRNTSPPPKTLYNDNFRTFLEKKLLKKAVLQKKHERIIKTLREKTRRLKKVTRNLKEMIKSLKNERDKVSSKKARKRKSITLKKSEQVHCPSDEDPEPQYLELDEEEPSSSHYEAPNKQIKIESCSSVAPTPGICEVNLDSGQESDRLYLLSFLPELSQLPRTIKMWAKTQIAQIMEEAVNQQLCGIMPNRPIKRDPISD